MSTRVVDGLVAVGVTWTAETRRLIRRAARYFVSEVLRCGAIPNHVAFIMDGNRRWAEQRNLKRPDGHAFGFGQLKECLKWCLDLGIHVVTVYAFSIENFKRPPEEVAALMRLAEDKLNELAAKQGFLERNGIRVQVLGDVDMLPEGVQRAASNAMRMSAGYNKAILNICFAYTGRHDIFQGVQHICRGVEHGTLQPGDVTEDLISKSLYTEAHSQVDLLVRTSGETRLSDFLLWQTTLGCVQFQHVLWPDFSLYDLAWAILKYQSSLSRLAKARRWHDGAVQRLQDSADKVQGSADFSEQVQVDAASASEECRQARLERQQAFVAALGAKRREFYYRFSDEQLVRSRHDAAAREQVQVQSQRGASGIVESRARAGARVYRGQTAREPAPVDHEAEAWRNATRVGPRDKVSRRRGLPQGWWPWAEMWLEAGEGVPKKRIMERICVVCLALLILVPVCCSNLI